MKIARGALSVKTIRTKGGGKIAILLIPTDNEIALSIPEATRPLGWVVKYLTPKGAHELAFTLTAAVSKLLRIQDDAKGANMPSHPGKKRRKKKSKKKKGK